MTIEERFEATERRIAELERYVARLDSRTFMHQRLGPSKPYDPDPDGKATEALVEAIKRAQQGKSLPKVGEYTIRERHEQMR